MQELWQPIPGFDGYEASSEGRTKGPHKIHKPWVGVRYLEVKVRNKTKRVHRLVALAFHGEPEPGMQCLHRDDNPFNNRPENLYWGTPQQNMDDRTSNGSMLRGEQIAQSKLTEEQVLEIRALASSGIAQNKIASAFGICPPHVSDIVNRKKWAHLP
jgi:hypothetical protein